MTYIFNVFNWFFSFLKNSTEVSVETLYLIIFFMACVIALLFLANIAVIVVKRLGF